MPKPIYQCLLVPWSDTRRRKSVALAEVGKSHCRNLQILLIVVLILSVSPKHAFNSLIKYSKLLNTRDSFSRSANHAHDSVPTNQILDASNGH